jgi:hypothetical protein
MTEILFSSVFLICVGYVIGKLFKGLNPFKLLFGLSFGFAICVGLIEADNNLYTGLFVFGALLNFANPLGGLFNAFEDYKLHKMYEKSLQSQKSSIENDLHEQVNNASNHYSQKEENLRREQEKLAREKADFERNKSNNVQKEVKKSVNESIAEAMEILGLKTGFTAHELKKAYKRESMKYHPDRGGKNPEHIKKLMELKFKEVTSAYNFLEGL